MTEAMSEKNEYRDALDRMGALSSMRGRVPDDEFRDWVRIYQQEIRKALEFMARNDDGMVVVPMDPDWNSIRCACELYDMEPSKIRNLYAVMISAYKPDGDGE